MSAEPVSEGRRLRRAARMAPDVRREMLMRAALRVFATRGLGEVRHADLAREAHVAVPTTFHYFPTKTCLLTAVLDEVARFLLEEIVAPHVANADPAPVVIERILMTFCDSIDTHPDHVRVWLEWGVSRREGVWDLFLIFYGRALLAMSELIQRGQSEGTIESTLDVEAAARVIVGLAHMIVQMKFSGSTREAITHTIHSLVRGYLVSHVGGPVPLAAAVTRTLRT